MDQILLFSGSSNLPLSEELATNLGVPLGNITLTRFADGEARPQIQEDVRNKLVFVLQSLSNPVDKNFIEMSLMADAIYRGSPKKIFAVIPYLGYSRQDRQHRTGEPISAKVIANLIEASKFDEVITIELHNNSIPGFYQIPVTNISLIDLYESEISKYNLNNIVIVSPDTGSAKQTRNLAEKLNAPQIIIEKKRFLDQTDVSESKSIGVDLNGKTAIIIDDMISTGGTIVQTIRLLNKYGAEKIIVMAAHGVFSGQAVDNIKETQIEKVIISNTIAMLNNNESWITKLSVAPILAKTIRNYIQ